MSSLNKRVKILWLLILLNSASTLNAQKSKDWDLAMHGFTFRYSTFTDVLNRTKALGINHVEVGTGTCDLHEVFRELKHQQFKGVFTIEYESKSSTLNEDLKESISFFREQSMKEPVCSPYVALEFNMKVPVKFFRAAPVNLGSNQKGFVTLFSEESNIDPFEGSFRFPENTPKLAVFTQDGKELWRCELPYSIPGIWFIPVLPFDMNRNGIDEIYYVANTGKLPFNYDTYKLVQADALTGRVTRQWDWTAPSHNQANSYKWRFFLIGGYVRNEPVLVTTQGTYRDMKLQAWNTDMRSRWTVTYPDDFKGSRGSHSSPVLDINNDGSYEFMYGERCISFDTGKELFVLDGEVWGDHSDMVLPVFNASDNQWNFFTTREKGDDGRLSRSVMFNQEGEHLWEISDKKGHYHYGWVGNFGARGERIAMAGRYPLKSENLPEKTCVGKTYDANTGDEVPIHFPLTGIVIDFNGDGIHEIYHDNSMYNNQGEKLFSTEKGTIAIAKKILNLPGEQLMLALPDGRVQIWADRNAKDTLAQKKRFADLMYYENVRHSASGYNFRLPILNF